MNCNSMNRTVTLPALPAPLPARTSAPHRASGPRQRFGRFGTFGQQDTLLKWWNVMRIQWDYPLVN